MDLLWVRKLVAHVCGGRLLDEFSFRGREAIGDNNRVWLPRREL
jgi:hypothetical protein